MPKAIRRLGVRTALTCLAATIIVTSALRADTLSPNSDNFELVANFTRDHPVRRLSKSVGRLDLILGSATGHRNFPIPVCTASIIDVQTILTAAHCLTDIPVGVSIRGINLTMNYLSTTGPSAVFRVDPTPMELAPDLDYVLLKVTDRLPDDASPLKASLGVIPENAEFLILHHPQGKPMRVSRRFCRVRERALSRDKSKTHSGLGLMGGDITRDVVLDHEIPHACDTLKGSSGGPIFLEKDGLLVGMQIAGGLNGSAKSFNLSIPFRAILDRSNILDGVETVIQPQNTRLLGFKRRAENTEIIFQTQRRIRRLERSRHSEDDVIFKMRLNVSSSPSGHLSLPEEAKNAVNEAVSEIRQRLDDPFSPLRVHVEVRGYVSEESPTTVRLSIAEGLAEEVARQVKLKLIPYSPTLDPELNIPKLDPLEVRGYAKTIRYSGGLPASGKWGNVNGTVEIRISYSTSSVTQ